jgi:hypothetical protein
MLWQCPIERPAMPLSAISPRTLLLILVAVVVFPITDVGLRLGILKVLGPRHLLLALVVGWVTHGLVLIGLFLLVRRWIWRTSTDSQAAVSN